MENDYDRIRAGIEFMTAYASGDDMLTRYISEQRHENPEAAAQMLDGTAALCALLLRKAAGDTGRTQHEILQELAHGTNEHEQLSDEGPEA
ncbi:hypothetical protein [Streptomyces sp. SCSIO ZS0520]|nr:hypothetical protein [Streptomyces sp. SCSIO ZS0520]